MSFDIWTITSVSISWLHLNTKKNYIYIFTPYAKLLSNLEVLKYGRNMFLILVLFMFNEHLDSKICLAVFWLPEIRELLIL